MRDAWEWGGGEDVPFKYKEHYIRHLKAEFELFCFVFQQLAFKVPW